VGPPEAFNKKRRAQPISGASRTQLGDYQREGESEREAKEAERNCGFLVRTDMETDPFINTKIIVEEAHAK
jgi:hypothetical protein